MIPDELKMSINSDPAILAGVPCFSGTRVPVRILVEHLEAGIPLDDFLQGFSSVKRQDVLAFVKWQGQLARQEFGLDLAS